MTCYDTLLSPRGCCTAENNVWPNVVAYNDEKGDDADHDGCVHDSQNDGDAKDHNDNVHDVADVHDDNENPPTVGVSPQIPSYRRTPRNLTDVIMETISNESSSSQSDGSMFHYESSSSSELVALETDIWFVDSGDNGIKQCLDGDDVNDTVDDLNKNQRLDLMDGNMKSSDPKKMETTAAPIFSNTASAGHAACSKHDIGCPSSSEVTEKFCNHSSNYRKSVERKLLLFDKNSPLLSSTAVAAGSPCSADMTEMHCNRSIRTFKAVDNKRNVTSCSAQTSLSSTSHHANKWNHIDHPERTSTYGKSIERKLLAKKETTKIPSSSLTTTKKQHVDTLGALSSGSMSPTPPPKKPAATSSTGRTRTSAESQRKPPRWTTAPGKKSEDGTSRKPLQVRKSVPPSSSANSSTTSATATATTRIDMIGSLSRENTRSHQRQSKTHTKRTPSPDPQYKKKNEFWKQMEKKSVRSSRSMTSINSSSSHSTPMRMEKKSLPSRSAANYSPTPKRIDMTGSISGQKTTERRSSSSSRIRIPNPDLEYKKNDEWNRRENKYVPPRSAANYSSTPMRIDMTGSISDDNDRTGGRSSYSRIPNPDLGYNEGNDWQRREKKYVPSRSMANYSPNPLRVDMTGTVSKDYQLDSQSSNSRRRTQNQDLFYMQSNDWECREKKCVPSRMAANYSPTPLRVDIAGPASEDYQPDNRQSSNSRRRSPSPHLRHRQSNDWECQEKKFVPSRSAANYCSTPLRVDMTGTVSEDYQPDRQSSNSRRRSPSPHLRHRQSNDWECWEKKFVPSRPEANYCSTPLRVDMTGTVSEDYQPDRQSSNSRRRSPSPHLRHRQSNDWECWEKKFVPSRPEANYCSTPLRVDMTGTVSDEFQPERRNSRSRRRSPSPDLGYRQRNDCKSFEKKSLTHSPHASMRNDMAGTVSHDQRNQPRTTRRSFLSRYHTKIPEDVSSKSGTYHTRDVAEESFVTSSSGTNYNSGNTYTTRSTSERYSLQSSLETKGRKGGGEKKSYLKKNKVYQEDASTSVNTIDTSRKRATAEILFKGKIKSAVGTEWLRSAPTNVLEKIQTGVKKEIQNREDTNWDTFHSSIQTKEPQSQKPRRMTTKSYVALESPKRANNMANNDTNSSAMRALSWKTHKLKAANQTGVRQETQRFETKNKANAYSRIPSTKQKTSKVDAEQVENKALRTESLPFKRRSETAPPLKPKPSGVSTHLKSIIRHIKSGRTPSKQKDSLLSNQKTTPAISKSRSGTTTRSSNSLISDYKIGLIPSKQHVTQSARKSNTNASKSSKDQSCEVQGIAATNTFQTETTETSFHTLPTVSSIGNNSRVQGIAATNTFQTETTETSLHTLPTVSSIGNNSSTSSNGANKENKNISRNIRRFERLQEKRSISPGVSKNKTKSTQSSTVQTIIHRSNAVLTFTSTHARSISSKKSIKNLSSDDSGSAHPRDQRFQLKKAAKQNRKYVELSSSNDSGTSHFRSRRSQLMKAARHRRQNWRSPSVAAQ